MKPLFRPARLADAPSLHRNCYPERTLEDVRSYLRWCLTQEAKGRIIRLVAEVDGQAIANGQLSIYRQRGEIGSLVVAPSYRRHGIGSMLLQALIDRARKENVRTIELMADAETQWLYAWYQRVGFSIVKERWLPHGERVVVLHRTLVSE